MQNRQNRGFYAKEVKIASIWPGSMPPIAKPVGPNPDSTAARRTIYKLEPVERGSAPFLLPVTDMFESVLNHMESDGKRKSFQPRMVACEGLADDLVREWAYGFPACPHEHRPGIMVISGDTPTQEELLEMRQTQERFMQWAFNEGERLHREHKGNQITPVMQLAAKWLGKDNVWSNPALASQTINCPWCKTLIPDDAIVCHQCSRQVRETPQAMAALTRPQQGQRPAA